MENLNQPVKTHGNPTFGDVTRFLARVNDDMNQLSIEQQDELCRKAGMPTITEQKTYWNQVEAQQRINENMLVLAEKGRNTMQHILNVTKSLIQIYEHQQKEIDQLQQKVVKLETNK